MLAEADDREHPNELRFINHVAGRLGMSVSEVREIDKDPTNLTFELPHTAVDRMTLMYDMLWLMKIDGAVVQDEKDLVMEIGLRLGFRQSMIEELIDVISQYIGKPVPPNALLDIIRKYSN
jgi:hypothetical protein